MIRKELASKRDFTLLEFYNYIGLLAREVLSQHFRWKELPELFREAIFEDFQKPIYINNILYTKEEIFEEFQDDFVKYIEDVLNEELVEV